MALEQTLCALEEQFWYGDGDFYREHVVEDALLVVPYQVLTKDQTVESIDAAPRWAELRIEDARAVSLTDDSALLAYRAQAWQADGAFYSALVTTGYVKRDGGWKLAHHHQTPIPQE